jgi:predicted secreted protein
MAKINGSNVVVWLDHLIGPTADDKILFTTNCTLTINHDLPDATSKDSEGWAKHISGLRSWEVTVDGLSDFGDWSSSVSGGNIAELWDLITNRRPIAKMVFAVDDDDDGSATEYYYGRVSLANLELTNEMESTASFSGTLIGKGELSTEDIFPII